MNIQKLLNDTLDSSADSYKSGHVATYIPALGKVDPTLLGITYYDLKNNKSDRSHVVLWAKEL